MYTAVLLPQIMYACSTWFIRGYGLKTAENYARKTLESIQYQILYRIAGTFRTTSWAALEILLHVPPPEVSLPRLAREACLRLMTSPMKETLHENRDLNPGPENGPLASPLQRLEGSIRSKLGIWTVRDIEPILPFAAPPWWEPPETMISDGREQALEAHKEAIRAPALVKSYTDGSATDGGVGAAVVSTLGTRRIIIGTPDTHTVYAAELEGIVAALNQILADEPHRKAKLSTGPLRAVIFTDNQAAIRALQDPGGPSGQYIIRDAIERIERLQQAGWNLLFQWVPGHEGAHGNELADIAAKDAAFQAAHYHAPDWEPGIPRRLPGGRKWNAILARSGKDYVLLASCRQRLRALVNEQWKQVWTGNPHGAILRKIIKAPDKKLLELHKCLCRAASSAVIQLQTGKVALAAYLSTISAMESPECECGLGVQDSKHILMECPTHEDERWQTLWKDTREPSYQTVMTKAPWIENVAQFILNIRILGQFTCLPAAVKAVI
jgi:ribonuclease HI